MRKIDLPLTVEGKGQKNKQSHRGKSFGYQVLGFGSGGVASPYMEATGGTVTEDGDYKVHKFTASSTFVVDKEADDASAGQGIRYLVVAGGGAVYEISQATGNTSSFNSIDTTGGAGGRHNSSPGTGWTGGAGGGGEQGAGGAGDAGGYTPPEGAPGGAGTPPARSPGGGGGGGASGVAGGGVAPANGGGNGSQSTIYDGTATYYAGGGGGGSHGPGFGRPPAFPGGSGGGGHGGDFSSPPVQVPGTDELGGGGGGSTDSGGGGGGGMRTLTTYTTPITAGTYPVVVGATDPRPQTDGGSGIVIVRYQFQ